MITPETLVFLSDLKRNNNREWFAENKTRFEAYKINQLEIATNLIQELSKTDEWIERLDPKKCIFRIYRDTRFSKNKTPYKTHLGIWIAPKEKEGWPAGYYVHIEPGNLSFIAAGIWEPIPEMLRTLRKEIALFHEDLKAILEEENFKKEFPKLLEENALKTVPKGYEKDHPAAHYLKLKSLVVTQAISDKQLQSKNFEKMVADKLSVGKTLVDFINLSISNPDT